MLDDVGARQDVLRVLEVKLVKGDGVGKERHFVVGHAPRNITMAAHEHDLPGLVSVGDGVRAAHVEVPVFLLQVDGDVDAVAGGLCALCHDAADAVADAALVERFLFLDRDVAVVRDDDDVFIDEAVREAVAVGRQRLGPPKAERLLNLRNLGGGGLELDHFARLVRRSRHPVLIGDDAPVVVLVVSDENFSGA